jgi:hypothetical protein
VVERVKLLEVSRKTMAPAGVSIMPISRIKIGTRHRRAMGDIAGLARNISEVGLLHPVVVTSDNALIAGERRIKAAEILGWTTIAATVIDLDDIVRGELAENTERKNFLPSEIDAIRQALEPLERSAATSRKLSGRSARNGGEVRDKIGAFAGCSGRTVEKIKTICEAAKADPVKFGRLKDDMDRTGRVNGVYQRLKIMRQADAIRAEPPPLPGNGPYRCLVTDPSWGPKVRGDDPSCRRIPPFPPMSIEEICAMRVADIAHDDCILWLWTTNADLLSGDALRVLEAWQFTPKNLLTWVKDRFGTAIGYADSLSNASWRCGALLPSRSPIKRRCCAHPPTAIR